MCTLLFLWIFSLQYTALIPRLEICLEVLEKLTCFVLVEDVLWGVAAQDIR